MEELFKYIHEAPYFAKVIAVVVAFNAVVLAALKILEIFKDKTTSSVDDKIYKVLSKIQKLLGLFIAYKPTDKNTSK